MKRLLQAALVLLGTLWLLFLGMLVLEVPAAYVAVFVLNIGAALVIAIGLFGAIVGTVVGIAGRKRPNVRYAAGLLVAVTTGVAMASLASVLFAYQLQRQRRFEPYVATIESLVRDKAPALAEYPPKLVALIVELDEPEFFAASPSDYLIAELVAWPRIWLGDRGPLRGTSAIATRVALALMRDNETVRFRYQGMGAWHVSHMVWTHAVQRFSKEELLRLHLYYLPFGRPEHVAAAASACFSRPAVELNDDELLRVVAMMNDPGAGYQNRNGVDSEQGPNLVNRCQGEKIERTTRRLADKLAGHRSALRR